jgi:hypothetical protein
MTNPFDNAELVSVYTVRQAVEDGQLVPLNGPHYPADGDAWLPAMVAEAGLKLPVYLTAGAFGDCVSPLDDNLELAPCQDIKGRLWDVLWMTAWTLRRASGDTFAVVKLNVRENIPKASGRKGRLSNVTLFAELGGDVDGSAYLTIMRPEDR